LQLAILESGRQLCSRLETAYTFGSRFRGWMMREPFGPGQGLHLKPCRSVHTFWMKATIDVLHLGPDGRVTGMEHRLKPGKIGRTFDGTKSVVELPEGTLATASVQVGQTAVIG